MLQPRPTALLALAAALLIGLAPPAGAGRAAPLAPIRHGRDVTAANVGRSLQLFWSRWFRRHFRGGRSSGRHRARIGPEPRQIPSE